MQKATIGSFLNKVQSASIEKSLIGDFIRNSGYYTNLATANTLSDVHISTGNAETIGAFFTCLRIKAETMASIHTYVQFYDGTKKSRDKGHSVDYLLSMKPNSQTNAWTFWYTMELIENIWGDSYAEIKRNRGLITSIHIMPAWEVEVKEVKETGAIWYTHKGRTLPARNVLHFKQNSIDGKKGRSIVSIQREQLGLAKKQENYAARTVGSNPPSLFEGGEGLDAQSAQKVAESFGDQVKKGITPIAWGGLKFKNVMMPAGDLQLFEMKGVTTADIYAMFRMPQSKGGNYSREAGATYNNVEQQNINFVQDVVIPSITQKENECNVKLFTREESKTHQVYFDLSELLKADLKTLTEHLKEGWGRGWYSANKVLEKLNENPIDDKHGDRHYVQAGFIPTDRVDEFLNSKQKPESQPKQHLNGHPQFN